MFKNFIVGFSAVIVIVFASMATNVQARLNQVFFSDNTSQPQKNQRLKIIDCESGASLVQIAGFNHVFATDCSGAQFSYNGFRKSREYTIVFNAHSGGIAMVPR